MTSVRHWLCWLLLVLSVGYCLLAGVLGKWTDMENGIDLSVCYVAGVTAVRGSSPYNYTALTKIRRSLDPVVAAKPSYTFAYPPSVVPACAILSRASWPVTEAVWKLLNLMFLIGSVLLAFQLLSHLHLTHNQRILSWSYAFALSPTVTVFLVGQSSLFVLFTLLLALHLSRQKKTGSAGLSLALALTKPQLTFPILCLLLYQRRFRVIVLAAGIFVGLCLLGLYLGNSDIHSYWGGLRTHSSSMDSANPHLVGIQSLATAVLGMTSPVSSLISVLFGVLLLAGIFVLAAIGRLGNPRPDDMLPLLLLLGVLSFRAHSYDMVFVIPVFIWALAMSNVQRRFLPIVVLCLLLVIPLRVFEILYAEAGSRFASADVFQVAVLPFRSWILVFMFALTVYHTVRPGIVPVSTKQPRSS